METTHQLQKCRLVAGVHVVLTTIGVVQLFKKLRAY